MSDHFRSLESGMEWLVHKKTSLAEQTSGLCLGLSCRIELIQRFFNPFLKRRKAFIDGDRCIGCFLAKFDETQHSIFCKTHQITMDETVESQVCKLGQNRQICLLGAVLETSFIAFLNETRALLYVGAILSRAVRSPLSIRSRKYLSTCW